MDKINTRITGTNPVEDESDDIHAVTPEQSMTLIKKITMKAATNTMLLMLSCVTIFHVLVLTQVIPYTIVWGGRLETASQMYTFETISLTINILILAVIAMKANYIKPHIPIRIINIILWLLVILFSLNTLGNIFALNTLEAILFTPLTFISAILCARIAIEQ